MLAAFQVRPLDKVDDTNMIERPHDCLEEGLALLFGLARWQLRDAVERHRCQPRPYSARACSRSWCPSSTTSFRCRAVPVRFHNEFKTSRSFNEFKTSKLFD